MGLLFVRRCLHALAPLPQTTIGFYAVLRTVLRILGLYQTMEKAINRLAWNSQVDGGESPILQGSFVFLLPWIPEPQGLRVTVWESTVASLQKPCADRQT